MVLLICPFFLPPVVSTLITEYFASVQRRLRDVSLPTLEKDDDKTSDSVPEFCIDAGSTGNIARFINHSCQPNLFVQCVLSVHHDVKLARVMLIAADNIPPLKVLSSPVISIMHVHAQFCYIFLPETYT